jgi:hypothetical protein
MDQTRFSIMYILISNDSDVPSTTSIACNNQPHTDTCGRCIDDVGEQFLVRYLHYVHSAIAVVYLWLHSVKTYNVTCIGCCSRRCANVILDWDKWHIN